MRVIKTPQYPKSEKYPGSSGMRFPFQYPLPKVSRRRVIRLEKEIATLVFQGTQENATT